MCLALPAEIVSTDGDTAVADVDGVQVPISIAFLPEVGPGDYVVVHVGYALSKIDAHEAQQQLAAMHAPALQEGASQ